MQQKRYNRAVSTEVVAILLVALLGSIFQSIAMFKMLLVATDRVRGDSLDVLLAQKEAFAQTLEHIKATQHVQGIPLQLAMAQHEAARDAQLADAKTQYELAKMDAEARRGAPVPRRPVPVPPQVAMGS